MMQSESSRPQSPRSEGRDVGTYCFLSLLLCCFKRRQEQHPETPTSTANHPVITDDEAARVEEEISGIERQVEVIVQAAEFRPAPELQSSGSTAASSGDRPPSFNEYLREKDDKKQPLVSRQCATQL